MSEAKRQEALLGGNILNQLGRERPSVVLNNQLEKLLFDFSNELIRDIKANMEAKDLNASGGLSASFQPLPIQSQNQLLRMVIKADEYWEDVEEGQKAGTIVDIPSLMEWISSKPIKVNGRKGAESLAHAIQYAIYKKGTIKRFGYQGSNFVSEVINDSRIRDFTEDTARITGQVLAYSVKAIFQK